MDSFSETLITGNPGSDTGGLVGYLLANGEVWRSYAAENLAPTTQTDVMGGLIGLSRGSVYSSFAKQELAVTSASYNSQSYYGGLAGELDTNDAVFVNSFAEVNLSTFTQNFSGGLFGRVDATVYNYNTYSSGSLFAPSNMGGIVGTVEAGALVTSLRSYFDQDTAGTTSSTFSGAANNTSALSKMELQTPGSGNSLDPFTVWNYSNSYPILRGVPHRNLND